jgi:hypothetical protein
LRVSGLVLKRFDVKGEPSARQDLEIEVVGRAPGLMAFLLGAMGLDPVTSLEVTPKAVYFTVNSLAGSTTRVIPMHQITSAYYGYHKPVELLAAAAGSIVTGPLCIIIAPILIVMYYLRKSLILSIVEYGGVQSSIMFKSSVIEGVSVDEAECARATGILAEFLVQSRGQRRSAGSAPSRPRASSGQAPQASAAPAAVAPSAVGGSASSLRILSGPRGGETLTIELDRRYTIGREAGIEISIPEDATLSRYQAQLYWDGSQWMLDNRGTYGVLIDGKVVNGTVALALGQTFQLGKSQFCLG